MICVCPEHLEIRRIVIPAITVDMVNHFRRVKMTSECLLHHEPVLANASMTIGMRMVRLIHQDVAMLVDATSARPAMVSLPLQTTATGRNTTAPKNVSDGLPAHVELSCDRFK
jgi:hypothetical protein